MRVFVLCTGRCGSVTFARACEHITNYTVSHEPNREKHFKARFTYPENHIVVDFRLAWMPGRLERYHGRDAFYVHLVRDTREVVDSFVSKAMNGKGASFEAWMRLMALQEADVRMLCADMVDNLNANISLFLRDKDWMPVRIEEAQNDFPAFWNRIGAEGDMEQAMREYDVKHNAGAA